MKTHYINGKEISIKSQTFEGKKSIEYYIRQIYSSLKRIGVTKDYVKIDYCDDLICFAEVLWKINGNDFKFRCQSQESSVLNLGAISQAIQEDVRQIMRGIKNIDLVMRQYETRRNNKIKKKTDLLNFENDNDSDKFKQEEEFDVSSLKIDNEVTGELNESYSYLTKKTNEEINCLYLKFKEDCIRHNTPNHPLLISLKIVRQRRGLKL